MVLSLPSPALKTFHFYFPLPLLFGNQQREPQALFLCRSYINYWFFFEFLKRTFTESSLAGLRNCLSCGTSVSGQYHISVGCACTGALILAWKLLRCTAYDLETRCTGPSANLCPHLAIFAGCTSKRFVAVFRHYFGTSSSTVRRAIGSSFVLKSCFKACNF